MFAPLPKLALSIAALVAIAGCGGGQDDESRMALENPYRSWNAVADFDLGANPSGPWRYMFDAPQVEPANMGATTTNCSDLLFPCWKVSSTAIDLPFIGVNRTGGAIVTRTVDVPDQTLIFHPGFVPPDGVGQRPVLAWVAPKNGNYKVEGAFKIVDTIPSGVRVIVKHEGDVLVSSPLNGFQNTLPLSFTLEMRKNDRLYFIVDAEGTHANDSTALTLTVSRVHNNT